VGPGKKRVKAPGYQLLCRRQKAEKIYTNSRFSKSQIRQLLKTAKSKIEIFTPSINKIDFTENITQKKQFLVLGDLQPRKRTKTIIKAFKQVQKQLPEHQLILVGKSDPAFAKYNIQTNQAIKIYSNLSQIDKTKLILESKALIYIPVFEGFGLPILEAIIYNKPIICSKLKVFKQNFKQYPIYVSSIEQLKTELLKFK
jgi:glycosyltransferase involved in cell wall biosynthesis